MSRRQVQDSFLRHLRREEPREARPREELLDEDKLAEQPPDSSPEEPLFDDDIPEGPRPTA
jgi:hypothetical protein